MNIQNMKKIIYFVAACCFNYNIDDYCCMQRSVIIQNARKSNPNIITNIGTKYTLGLLLMKNIVAFSMIIPFFIAFLKQHRKHRKNSSATPAAATVAHA